MMKNLEEAVLVEMISSWVLAKIVERICITPLVVFINQGLEIGYQLVAMYSLEADRISFQALRVQEEVIQELKTLWDVNNRSKLKPIRKEAPIMVTFFKNLQIKIKIKQIIIMIKPIEMLELV